MELDGKLNFESVLSTLRKQRKMTDLVGIDFSTTAIKVVRIKKGKDGLSLADIDLFSPVDFGAPVARIELPRNIAAHYGCLAYSAPDALIRMINVKPEPGETTLPEAKIREVLNVDEDYRVSALAVKGGGPDPAFLAVAIPERDARFLLGTFPAGPPAPISIETSGLAFAAAFMNACPEESADETICLIDVGETLSHFIFLDKGAVVLAGKFGFGAGLLRARVATDLEVDEELAETILMDQSINVSASLMGAMAAFVKQLSISRDFIERHRRTRVSKVYVSGGLSLLPAWMGMIRQMLHADVLTWDPLRNVHCPRGVLSEEMAGQATRFAAAIGAAVGGFE